jgi:hypothetical protein
MPTERDAVRRGAAAEAGSAAVRGSKPRGTGRTARDFAEMIRERAEAPRWADL